VRDLVERAVHVFDRERRLIAARGSRVQRALQQGIPNPDPSLRGQTRQVRDREGNFVGRETREQRREALDLREPSGELGDLARSGGDFLEERRQRLPT
jgi:hypothetical protein